MKKYSLSLRLVTNSGCVYDTFHPEGTRGKNRNFTSRTNDSDKFRERCQKKNPQKETQARKILNETAELSKRRRYIAGVLARVPV